MEKKQPKTNLKKEIVNIPIRKIKPYWRNARKNTETIKLIKESVTRFGFNGTILLDKDYTIINGHGRFAALVQLGWEVIPCEISNLNEKDTKALRIIDNKISEKTEWSVDELMMEIREIGEIEQMQKYFNVDLHVEKFKGNQETQFTDRVNSNIENMIEITCPHCLETIEVGQKQLEDKLK
jgi:hypothetical protein